MVPRADSTAISMANHGSASEGEAPHEVGGGSFLTAPVPDGEIMSRERLSDEQREIGRTARRFVATEVMPRLEAVEHKADITVDGGTLPLSVHLLKRSAELGLAAADIPEAYGGLGLDKVTSMHIAECSAGCPSFSTTSGAHCGIGTLPIVLFGDERQKQAYLPRLASAELVSCYALTEPGSGSDALSGKTRAVLDATGTHYLITGEKRFITNGGWADMAIVFAGVDGRYSAFIVDLHSVGVQRGREEKKMGIRGSSTTSLVFEDVRVPREHLLGRVGDGAAIALNILNLGRLKLGFGALGTCKVAFDLGLAYGKSRKQFGQPIVTFDLQRGKLGHLAARIYALDAMAYRTAGTIAAGEARLMAVGEGGRAPIDLVRSLALEAAIIKVAGSETLRDVIDGALKLHGGYGYVEEYQLERLSRDNVIDMIFEGTNDINRLVIADELVRNIFAGAIGFREFMNATAASLRHDHAPPPGDGALGMEAARVMAAKRAVAFTVQAAVLGCGRALKTEQQVAQALADAMSALYAMDSTLARVRGAGCAPLPTAIARLVTQDGCATVERLTREVVVHVVRDGRQVRKLAELERLQAAHGAVVDVVSLRRQIADMLIEAGRYDI